MNRFETLFGDGQKRAFIPFWMLGDPDCERSLLIIKALIEAGADALELGIPFSDPLADGPTIQGSAARALAAGCTVQKSIELIARLRSRSDIPIGLLVYYNLIYRRGVETFCRELADAGADAVLAADLPLEESEPLEVALRDHSVGCVQLVAPNTPPARALQLIQRSTAFTYVVSTFGTTGARVELDRDTEQRVRDLRARTDQPLVVGFGISQPRQAITLHEAGASGVIVGSALVQHLEPHFDDAAALVRNAERFVKDFHPREATKPC